MVGRKAEKSQGTWVRAVSTGQGAVTGSVVAGLLLFELGLRLGLQLHGGSQAAPSRLTPRLSHRVSRPSEFSSISWMRGTEPGISIFSVITRQPLQERTGQWAPPCSSSPARKPGPRRSMQG